ncbi:MAG: UvrD-helicase domain-containing protein [Syntrophorhabdales bacterium]
MRADDAPLRFPHFTVLRASAGSGKTYALARRFVLFLLSDGIPKNGLANLLAITFSNNAAKEMKERILLFLKQLYLGDDRKMVNDFSRDLALAEPVLKARAGGVIEAILSRYSDFQVKTIDSFMTTVFKASALDFGYNPDFEILMSNESLMGYAFDLFLRRVREGTREGRLMEDVIDIIVENAMGDAPYPWEATGAILAEIEKIYRKVASCGKPVSRTDYSVAIDAAKKDIRSSIDEMERIIIASGLTRRQSSSYGNVLKDARAGRFSDLIERGMKTPPVCKPSGEEESEACRLVGEEWERLTLHIASFARLFACSYYTPYLRTYEAFKAILDRVTRREGKIFIEDVNKRLAEYLDGDIVPDVYFRLGEVIFHYLIDEFQDTSPIQWRNLLPLIENSLSQGGSLFVVGDTKQAIYGFRDADYRIMRRVEAHNPFPSAEQRNEELGTNYRSDGAIIDFSEEVFHRTLPRRLPDYEKAGEESGLLTYRQAAIKDRRQRGFVETCMLERGDGEPPEKERIYDLLDRLRERGYRYPDIAILAPRNDDVVKVTTWLSEKKVPFVSYSSLDIRRRKIIGEIVSLLTFLDSPLDDLSFATFILGDILGATLEKAHVTADSGVFHDLCFRNRGKGRKPLYKVFQEERPDMWDAYFDRLFRLSGYLPLYDLVVEVYRVFDVFGIFPGEEAALSRMLEVIKDIEAKGGGTRRGFLEFALAGGSDEADWNIDIPYGVDAVKVMTVHKAKGLEFPVVILLLYGERNKGFRYIVQEDEESITLLRLRKGMLRADDAFEMRYREEETKVMAARLNSLYVAFTRAGSELYVIGVKGERERGLFPFPLLPDTPCFSMGEPWEAPPDTAKEARPAVEALHHTAFLESPHAPEEELRFEEKKRGEVVHKVLSLVGSGSGDILSGLDEILDAVRHEAGADAVPEGLERTIADFLEDDAIAPLYGERPGRVVMVEQELADSEGRLFRVDRLVVDPDRVVVVEYKTGREAENEARHLAQMTTYLRIVGELYRGRRVEGLIAYVDLLRMRRVHV